MILEDIAAALRNEGYQVQVSPDSVLVFHGSQQIERLTKVDEYLGGNAFLLESDEDGIQYEVRRTAKRIEMTQLLEVLAEHRGLVDDERRDVDTETD